MIGEVLIAIITSLVAFLGGVGLMLLAWITGIGDVGDDVGFV